MSCIRPKAPLSERAPEFETAFDPCHRQDEIRIELFLLGDADDERAGFIRRHCDRTRTENAFSRRASDLFGSGSPRFYRKHTARGIDGGKA